MAFHSIYNENSDNSGQERSIDELRDEVSRDINNFSRGELELVLRLIPEIRQGHIKERIQIINMKLEMEDANKASLSFLSEATHRALVRNGVENLEALLKIINTYTFPVNLLSQYKKFGSIKIKEVIQQTYLYGHIHPDKYNALKKQWEDMFRKNFDEDTKKLNLHEQ